MTRRRPGRVYRLLDSDTPGVQAVVRYSGDPDEFVALAHAWLIQTEGSFFDAPYAIAAPELAWFRFNPESSDEYAWQLGHPTGPGRGNWRGSLLRLVQIGCSECRYLHGRHDPSGCLNADIDGLVTLQFGGRDVSDHHPMSRLTVHAVRSRGSRPGRMGGTPGPTLCDIDRFSPGTQGWSVGGGVIDRNMQFHACYLCGQKARRDFPGLPISGSLPLAKAFAAGAGVPLAGHLVAQDVARTGRPRLVVV